MNSLVSKNWLNAWSIAVLPYVIVIPGHLATKYLAPQILNTNPFLWEEIGWIFLWSNVYSVLVGVPFCVVAAVVYLFLRRSAKRRSQAFRNAQIVVNGLLTLFGVVYVSRILLIYIAFSSSE